MSQTDASFDALRVALLSLYSDHKYAKCEVRRAHRTLLLHLPTDVAAFSVFNGDVQQEFNSAYEEFKSLYRENHGEWDRITLSFVLCRIARHSEDDRFYAALENDTLFCRKYVIQAYGDISSQRKELLRLPFLPLPDDGQNGLLRPRSAQDLLQTAGMSASLARKLVEAGHRSPEGIASDLQDGVETIPERLKEPSSQPVALSRPRACSRLLSASLEKFRAYRKRQEFDLDASVVVLYGPNGLGKTSFFDAIDYACTGRIGRLCRLQTRSPSEFASVSTHLDETPGTGSVVLRGKTNPNDAEATMWTLTRATGDWSTAWINADKCDRKQVLSFLTNANWLDSRPRQQNFETLFRATHLFGQDEQELLVEFRKGSIIPEEFISEMLALQDYSQGLSKIKDLQVKLASQRTDHEQQIRSLLDETDRLSKLLPTVSEESSDAKSLTPIEEIVASLRQKLTAIGLAESAPPDKLTLLTCEEWRDLLSAQLQTFENRVSDAVSLREEIPAHQRKRADLAESQKQLTEAEQDAQALREQIRDTSERVEFVKVSLQDNESRSRQIEQRRRDLRSVLEAITTKAELTIQAERLRLEITAQNHELSELTTRLNATDLQLSKVITSKADLLGSLADRRNDIDAISRCLDGFPQFAKDTSELADIGERLENAEADLRHAGQYSDEAIIRLRKATVDRESLQPEYERELARQAELDQLLDNIESHIHDVSCPLCGTAFDTLDSLLNRIRQQRMTVHAKQDVTLRYKGLMTIESQASDDSRVAGTKVAAAKAHMEDLMRMRAETTSRLATFRNHVFSILSRSSADLSEATLVAYREELTKQIIALEQAVNLRADDLNVLESTRASDQALRDLRQERKVDCDREMQKCFDRISHIRARNQQLLQQENIAESQLEPVIGQLTLALDDLALESEQLNRQKESYAASLDDLKIRSVEVSSRQEVLLVTLKHLRQAIADIQRRLTILDLPDDADRGHFERAISQLERYVASLREARDKSREIADALRSREMRLQFAEIRQQLENLKTRVANSRALLERNQKAINGCEAIEDLLSSERQVSIEKHISAYGPLITNIQQRLRSVYGFGSVQLKARGGEAAVQVEWRNRSVQVPPTDFFSDSQKQILMLSIFLAGGLRQNWSGFAPVLLDDPVTHFDDLNAYGFVELIRGIVSSEPNGFQFLISTCEERLFSLMQKKFTRLEGGAHFYEYLGMSADGPIVERHDAA